MEAEVTPINTKFNDERQSALVNRLVQNSPPNAISRRKRAADSSDDESPGAWTLSKLNALNDQTFKSFMKEGSKRLNERFFSFLETIVLNPSDPNRNKIRGWFTNPEIIGQTHPNIFQHMSLRFAIWLIRDANMGSNLNKHQASKLLDKHHGIKPFNSLLFNHVSPEIGVQLLVSHPNIYFDTLNYYTTSRAVDAPEQLRDLQNLLICRNSQTGSYLFGTGEIASWTNVIDKIPPFVFQNPDVALRLWRNMGILLRPKLISEQIRKINFLNFDSDDLQLGADHIFRNILPDQIRQFKINVIQNLLNSNLLRSFQLESVIAMCASVSPRELNSESFNLWVSSLDHRQQIEFLQKLPVAHLENLPARIADSILNRADSSQYGTPPLVKLLPLATIHKTNADKFFRSDVLRHFDRKIAGERAAAVFTKEELFIDQNIRQFYGTLSWSEKLEFLGGLPPNYITSVLDLKGLVQQVAYNKSLDKIPDNFYANVQSKWWEFLTDNDLEKIKWDLLIEKSNIEALDLYFRNPHDQRYIQAAWKFLFDVARPYLPISAYPRWRKICLKLIQRLDPRDLFTQLLPSIPDITKNGIYASPNYASFEDLKDFDITFFTRLERSNLRDVEVSHIINFLFTEDNICGLSPEIIKKLDASYPRIWKALSHLCIYYFNQKQLRSIPDAVLYCLLGWKVFHKNDSWKLLGQCTARQKEVLAAAWDLANLDRLSIQQRTELRGATETLPSIQRREIIYGVSDVYQQLNPGIINALRADPVQELPPTRTIVAIVTEEFRKIDNSPVTDPDDPDQDNRVGHLAINNIIEKSLNCEDIFVITEDTAGNIIYWKLKPDAGIVLNEKLERLREIRSQFGSTDSENRAKFGGPTDAELKSQIKGILKEIRDHWKQNIVQPTSWIQCQRPAEFPIEVDGIVVVAHGDQNGIGGFNTNQVGESIAQLLQNNGNRQLRLLDLVNCETDKDALSQGIDAAFQRHGKIPPHTIKGYVNQIAPFPDTIDEHIQGKVYLFLDGIQYVHVGGRCFSSPLTWKRKFDGNNRFIIEEFEEPILSIFRHLYVERAQALRQYQLLIYDAEATQKVQKYKEARTELVQQIATIQNIDSNKIYLIRLIQKGTKYYARYYNSETQRFGEIEILRTYGERLKSAKEDLKPGLEYLKERYRLDANGNLYEKQESVANDDKKRLLANALCKNSPSHQVELILESAYGASHLARNEQWLGRWIQNRVSNQINPGAPSSANIVQEMRADCKVTVMVLKIEGENQDQIAIRMKAVHHYLEKYPSGDKPEIVEVTRLQDGSMQLRKYDPQSNIYRLLPNNSLEDRGPCYKIVVFGHSGQNVAGEKTIGGWTGSELGSHFQSLFKNMRDISKVHMDTCGSGSGLENQFGKQFFASWPDSIRFEKLEISIPRTPMFISGVGVAGRFGITVAEGHRLYVLHQKLYHGLPYFRAKFWRNPDNLNQIIIEDHDTKGSTLLIDDPTPHAGPLGPEMLETIRHQHELAETKERLGILSGESGVIENAVEYAQATQEESKAQQKIQDLERSCLEAEEIARRISGKSDGVLLLGTIRKNSHGEIEVIRYHQTSNQEEIIRIRDPEEQRKFENLKKTYDEEMENLRFFKKYLSQDPHGNITFKAGALDALRALSQTRGGKTILGFSSGIFGIRAWASYFMKQDTGSSTSLSLQVGAYCNLADATAGMSDDVVRLAKVAIQRFTREGGTLAQGAVRVLRGLGNTLKIINLGLTVGSIGMDIYLLATTEDEEIRTGAAISLGTTLVSLGVAVVAGPLAALPVALLGLLISYLIQGVLERRKEISQTLDTLVDLNELLEKGGFEVKDQVLWFHNIAIKKVDFPDGKITFDSHKIRAIHERDTHWQERPYGSLREGLGYPAERKFNLSQIPRIRILPSETKKHSYQYVTDSCATTYTATESQKRVWEKLVRHGTIQRPTSGSGSGHQINCAPRSVEKSSSEEVSLEVILDEGSSTYRIPEKAGENAASYAFRTHAKGGAIFLTGFHPGVKLAFKDADPLEQPSLVTIQVNVPLQDILKQDLVKEWPEQSVEGTVRIISREDKKFVAIKYPDGKVSEIEITALRKSRIQILIKDQPEEADEKIKSKVATLEIAPEATLPEIQAIHFIGYHRNEAQNFLKRKGLKHKTPISFEPSQPKPPPAVDIQIAPARRLSSAAHPQFHVTKTTTTAQTKIIENYIVNAAGIEIGNIPGEPRRTTLDTPPDDPYFKKRENYFKALIDNRAKTVTTYWDAETENILWFDELNSGFTQAVANQQGSNALFFQPPTGKLFRIDLQSSARATYELPLIHEKSFISHLIQDGNFLHLEQMIPSPGDDQKFITITYKIEGSKVQIQEVRGLSESQLAQLVSFSGHGANSPLAETLARILGGERPSGNITITNSFKVEVTGTQGSRQYVITPNRIQIPLLEGEQIEGELTQGSEKILILHSIEKKTVRFIKLNSNSYSVLETAELIAKVFFRKPSQLLMIKEGGKEMMSYNPFTKAMKSAPVPRMARPPERKYIDPATLNIRDSLRTHIELAYQEARQTWITKIIPYGKRGEKARLTYKFQENHPLQLVSIEGLDTQRFEQLIQGSDRDFLTRLDQILDGSHTVSDYQTEDWVKVVDYHGKTVFLHPRTGKSISAEKDSRLLLGSVSSTEERYLLWSPNNLLAKIVTLKLSRGTSHNLPAPVISAPLFQGQPFTKPLILHTNKDHSFSLISEDGKKIYKLNTQGNLFLHDEPKISFYTLSS